MLAWTRGSFFEHKISIGRRGKLAFFLLRKTNVSFGLQSFGKSTKQLRVNHSSSFSDQARLHLFDYSWSPVDNSNSSMTLHSSTLHSSTLHSSNTMPVEFDSGGFLLWKPIKCLKRSNNRSFRICGWEKHGQRNHIEMTRCHRFSKSPV